MRKVYSVSLALILVAVAGIGVAAQRFNMAAPLLPDPSLTPGDALDVTPKDICTQGYAKRVRNVPQAVKEQAYKEYGIAHREKGEYEIDHLISLELGGSNSIKNLWPQSFQTQPWNAHVKDKLENAYHDDICAGRIDIKVAQQKIASNWIVAYKERFPDDPVSRNPTPGFRSGTMSPMGNAGRPFHLPMFGHKGNPAVPMGGAAVGNGQVWVNLKSGVYWRPGTQYYGKTKKGKYMSEQDAIHAGYHAAKGQ